MAPVTQTKSPYYYKVKGVSLYGRFATVLLTDSAVEVHTTPSWLFVLGMWLAAIPGMMIGILFDGLIMLFVLTFLFGTIGALLVWNLYIGKLVEKYSYNDIVSFVSGGAEMSINMKNYKMYALRMMPKRQEKMLTALEQIMYEHTGFVLKQDGEYFRVFSKRELEEEQNTAKK